MDGDTPKMMAVGLVWGASYAVKRRGALLWHRRHKTFPPPLHPPRRSPIRVVVLAAAGYWFRRLLFWEYSLPLMVNLFTSATLACLSRKTPISPAVLVTTFGAVSVTEKLLEGETRFGLSLLCTSMIVLGVYLFYVGVLELHS